MHVLGHVPPLRQGARRRSRVGAASAVGVLLAVAAVAVAVAVLPGQGAHAQKAVATPAPAIAAPADVSAGASPDVAAVAAVARAACGAGLPCSPLVAAIATGESAACAVRGRAGGTAAAVPLPGAPAPPHPPHTTAAPDTDADTSADTAPDPAFGVVCLDFEGVPRVTQLLWNGMGLAGSLSPLLGELAQLRTLALNDNAMTGALPGDAFIGLTALELFNIQGNAFSGPVPWAALASASRLQYLNVRQVQLDPAVDATLTSPGVTLDSLVTDIAVPSWGATLTALVVSNVGLSGTVPASLSGLPHLQELYLDMNTGIHGPLAPVQATDESESEAAAGEATSTAQDPFAALTELAALDIKQTEISGPLPASLLSAPKLHTLVVSRSRVSFGLADVAAALAAVPGTPMRVLQAAHMKPALSGSVPAALGGLSRLEYLDLQDNALGGTIPAALGSLDKLNALYLNSNRLSGGATRRMHASLDGGNDRAGAPTGMPAALSGAASLQTLVVADNPKLRWSLDEAAAALASVPGAPLTELDLSNTGLRGSIPRSIARLHSLVLLDLGNNPDIGHELVVPAPPLGNASTSAAARETECPVCQLTQLQVLDIYGTQVGGPVPAAMSALTELRELRVGAVEVEWDTPSLSGTLPDMFGNFSKLEVLHVSNTNVGGDIPASLGACVRLRDLTLENNQFPGLFPESILLQCQRLESLKLVDTFTSMYMPWPGSLSNATSLQELDVSFSSFRGDLPHLSATQLRIFRADNSEGGLLLNRLPPSVQVISAVGAGVCIFSWTRVDQWPNLESLNLMACPGEYDAGSVVLPTAGVVAASVTKLTHLIVPGQICGPLPPEIRMWTQLRVLNVASCVNGTLPELPGAPDPDGGLLELVLSGSDLDTRGVDGTFPAEIAQHRHLQRLDIAYTNLRGPMPESLQSLEELTYFRATGAPLGGTLSETMLEGMVSLQQLQLDLTGMSGTIPSAVGHLRHLQALDLHGNQFTWLPASLGSSPVRYLDVSNNMIESTIPDGLGSSGNLTVAMFGYNRIRGSPPLSLLPVYSAQGWYDASLDVQDGCNVDRRYSCSIGGGNTLDLAHNKFGVPLTLELFTALFAPPAGPNPGYGFSNPSLNDMGWTGTLPAGIWEALGNTSSPPDKFSAAHNRFEGAIPDDPTGSYFSSVYEWETKQVDLSANRFTSAPDSLLQAPGLQSLDLSYNLIEALPANLSMVRLQRLSLAGNPLRALPERVHLPRLERLDISSCRLTRFPERWGTLPRALPQLDTLYAQQNQLVAIPDILVATVGTIIVYDNALTELPSFPVREAYGGYFQTHIDARWNSIGSVRDGQIPMASTLRLDYNGLRELPTVMNVTDSFTVSHNRLTRVPRVLPGVFMYDVSYNQLTQWPPQVADCSLFGKPDEYGGLTTLRLSSNQLQPPTLPRCFAVNVSSTQELQLAEMGLRGTIPDAFASGAIILNMSHNRLSGALAPWLFDSSIVALDLSHNALASTVPDAVGRTSMSLIRLNDNRLTGTFPDFGLSKRSCNGLYLHNNCLEGALPTNWSAWTSLNHAFLGGRDGCQRLTGSLSESLTTLSQLRNLDVGGLPLSGPFPQHWSPSIRFFSGSGVPFDWAAAAAGSASSGGVVLPESLYAAPDLATLVMTNTGLPGRLPGGVSRSLAVADLSYNQLSGPLPREWASLPMLTELRLTHNAIDGTLSGADAGPAPAQEAAAAATPTALPLPFSQMGVVWLDLNRLSGSISDAVAANVSSAHDVRLLSGNLWECPIPDSLASDPYYTRYLCNGSQPLWVALALSGTAAAAFAVTVAEVARRSRDRQRGAGHKARASGRTSGGSTMPGAGPDTLAPEHPDTLTGDKGAAPALTGSASHPLWRTYVTFVKRCLGIILCLAALAWLLAPVYATCASMYSSRGAFTPTSTLAGDGVSLWPGTLVFSAVLAAQVAVVLWWRALRRDRRRNMAAIAHQRRVDALSSAQHDDDGDGGGDGGGDRGGDRDDTGAMSARPGPGGASSSASPSHTGPGVALQVIVVMLALVVCALPNAAYVLIAHTETPHWVKLASKGALALAKALLNKYLLPVTASFVAASRLRTAEARKRRADTYLRLVAVLLHVNSVVVPVAAVFVFHPRCFQTLWGGERSVTNDVTVRACTSWTVQCTEQATVDNKLVCIRFAPTCTSGENSASAVSVVASLPFEFDQACPSTVLELYWSVLATTLVVQGVMMATRLLSLSTDRGARAWAEGLKRRRRLLRWLCPRACHRCAGVDSRSTRDADDGAWRGHRMASLLAGGYNMLDITAVYGLFDVRVAMAGVVGIACVWGACALATQQGRTILIRDDHAVGLPATAAMLTAGVLGAYTSMITAGGLLPVAVLGWFGGALCAGIGVCGVAALSHVVPRWLRCGRAASRASRRRSSLAAFAAGESDDDDSGDSGGDDRGDAVSISSGVKSSLQLVRVPLLRESTRELTADEQAAREVWRS